MGIKKFIKIILSTILMMTLVYQDTQQIQAKEKTTLYVNQTQELDGRKGYNHCWEVIDGQEYVELVNRTDKSTIKVKAKAVGTATIIHYYGSNRNETFEIAVENNQFHYMYSNQSSNVQLFYSIDGQPLQELVVGERLDATRENKIVYFTKVKDGYSAGTTFSHRNGSSLDEQKNNNWMNGNYTDIKDFNIQSIGNEFVAALEEAKNLGCTYEFHYSDQSEAYRYREFQIKANPVFISVVYDLNGGTGDGFIDHAKYSHPDVTENGYAHTITLPTDVPVKEKTKFIGWQLNINEEVYSSSTAIAVADVWQHPDKAETIYTFTAQYVDLYNVTYYRDATDTLFDDAFQDKNDYSQGDKITLPTVNEEKFIGWTTDPNLVGNEDNLITSYEDYQRIISSDSFYLSGTHLAIASEDLKLYAVWASAQINDKYTITIVADEGINTSDTIENITYGQNQRITFEAKLGYTIKEVKVDGQALSLDKLNGQYTFNQITQNHQVIITSQKDLSVQKTSSYFVEHWVEGETTYRFKETISQNLWINDEDYLNVTKESIQAKTIIGYKLDTNGLNYQDGDQIKANTTIPLTYKKDDTQTKKIGYNVNYYIDGQKDLAHSVKVMVDVWVLADTYSLPQSFFEGLPNKYTGYKLETNINEMPSSVKENDSIDIYYVKDTLQRHDISYSVEYYLDNQASGIVDKFTDSVWINEATTLVTEDKVNKEMFVGCTLEKIEPNLPTQVGHNGNIKVYYKSDLSKVRPFSYTIEYYIDNQFKEEKQINTTVWAGEPEDTVKPIDPKEVTSDRYVGYQLSGLPSVMAKDNERIRVDYVKDETQQKTLSYNVHYYKDNLLDEVSSYTQFVSTWINDTNEIQLDKTTIDNANDKFMGYQLNTANSTVIPDKVSSGDTIHLYYEKNEQAQRDFMYSMHYFIDGELTEQVSFSKKIWAGEASDYQMEVDLSSVNEHRYPGYQLSPLLPSIKVKHNGIIEIHYVRDESQTRQISYQIQHVVGDEVRESDMIIQDIWSGDNQTNTLKVEPINYRTYDNYVVDRTEPNMIPKIIENDGVIRIYYAMDIHSTLPNTPDVGDGIADKYQAMVRFEAVNGSITNNITYVTLLDELNQPAVDGAGYLSAAQLPVVNVDTGYDQNSADWGNTGEPTITSRITEDRIYRVSFLTNIPVIPTPPLAAPIITITPNLPPVTAVTPVLTLPVDNTVVANVTVDNGAVDNLNDEPVVEEINDNQVPLANSPHQNENSSGYWALINFFCAIITIVLAGLLLLSKKRKENQYRNKWVMIITTLIAIGTFILFIFTENMMLTMTMSDQWTIPMIGLLIAQILVLMYGRRWYKEKNEEHIS